MPRKRSAQQARAKRTREELLDAAQQLFSERHYADATVDDITAGAGVSKGAFYFHFRSKEDVLIALARNWSRDVATSVEGLAPRGNLERSSLREALDRLFSAGKVGWQPRLIMELLAQAEQCPPIADAFAGAGDAWKSAAARLVLKARRSGIVNDALSPDATATALLAIRDGLTMQACLSTPNDAIDVRSATKAALALLRREPEGLRRAS